MVKDIALDKASDVKAVFVSFGKEECHLLKSENSIREKLGIMPHYCQYRFKMYCQLSMIPLEDPLLQITLTIF